MIFSPVLASAAVSALLVGGTPTLSAVRSARTLADSLPFDTTQVVVTPEDFGQLKTFLESISVQDWNRPAVVYFMRTHQLRYPMAIGDVDADVPASFKPGAPIAIANFVLIADSAERFPAFAKGLAKAKLSGRRYLQLLRTLNVAWMTEQLDRQAHPGKPRFTETNTVVGKNVAFIRAHRDDFWDLVQRGLDVNMLPHALVTVGSVAPQLTVSRWLNDSLSRGGATTFGDGHVYIVNFTAHWCGPCKAVYPVLTDVQAKYGAAGVRVVYATTLFGKDDMTPAAEFDMLKQYMTEHGLKAAMMVADRSELLKYFEEERSMIFPRVVVIDGAGKVQAVYPYPVGRDVLDVVLDKLVASAPKPGGADRR